MTNDINSYNYFTLRCRPVYARPSGRPPIFLLDDHGNRLTDGHGNFLIAGPAPDDLLRFV